MSLKNFCDIVNSSQGSYDWKYVNDSTIATNIKGEL